ncbi:MAG: hypothetical protein WCX27_01165 [Candidatus Paceibacterota bacterium]|jgi:hypothetical protein
MINKIKNWPDEKKRIFAAVTAVVVTAIIVVFWFGFGRSWNSTEATEDNAVYESGPMDLIKQTFQSVADEFADLKDRIGGVVNATSTEGI